jgi:hypothetical protein
MFTYVCLCLPNLCFYVCALAEYVGPHLRIHTESMCLYCCVSVSAEYVFVGVCACEYAYVYLYLLNTFAVCADVSVCLCV